MHTSHILFDYMQVGCTPSFPHAADLAVKDSSDYTPLDYATENGLHYCGLLLSKPQQSMESDEDNHRCMHKCFYKHIIEFTTININNNRYSHLGILL